MMAPTVAEPLPMVAGNGYQQQHPPELRLSTDIMSAAARLRDSAVAAELFGRAFVDHYATTREWEGREYHRHVSDWEKRRYFEII